VVVCGTLVLMVISRSLEETLPQSRRQSSHFKSMLKSFGYLLGNAKFNAYAFMVAFNTSAYFAFLGGSSYVLIDLMGLTASELGVAFVAVSGFYIFGNFLTARFSPRFGVNRLIAFGAVLCLFGSLGLVFFGQFAEHTAISFIALMSFIAFGNGFCVSTGMASAIGADPNRIGAASGLAGFMQIGFGALATFIVGTLFGLFPGTAMPLSLTILACCFLAVCSFAVGLWTFRKAAAAA
jgi:DHA1 family bicyclomycin/chloramphenicol resistance-like MFS transporter